MIHRLKCTFDSRKKRIMLPCKVSDSLSDTPEWIDCMALVDTGAQISCVSSDFASRMRFPHFFRSEIQFALGTSVVRNYLINLRIMDEIEVKDLIVADFPIPEIDVIIGMDILSLGNLSMKNTKGILLFSFSISDHAISSLEHFNRNMAVKMI